MRIAVTLEKPGIVVLADRFDPGWKLTIDGKEADLLKANHLMRAAAVGKGAHTLVYRYDPWTVRAGGLISLAGLVFLVAGSVWAGRPRDETGSRSGITGRFFLSRGRR